MLLTVYEEAGEIPAQSRYCDTAKVKSDTRIGIASIGTRVSLVKDHRMSQATTATPEFEVPTIAVSAIAPWALFFALLSAIVVFFVGAEQGALSIFSGTAVHEWVHDGRHLLGYPCH